MKMTHNNRCECVVWMKKKKYDSRHDEGQYL